MNKLRSLLVQVENVSRAAQHRKQRHHRALANGIDRRIGDLREQLLEVIRQMLRPLRKHRQWCVRAHGADGVFTVLYHGFDEYFQIFPREAK